MATEEVSPKSRWKAALWALGITAVLVAAGILGPSTWITMALGLLGG